MATETSDVAVPQPPRSVFFFGIALVILMIVLIGFTPTLYLRALFDVPSIPGYVYVHGAILTGWFVWLVIQTWLIRTRRVAVHRRLGAFGIVVGVAVVIVSSMVTLDLISRIKSQGISLDMDISALGIGTGVTIGDFISMATWLNIASVLAFSGLLTSAVLFRHHRETHKRLMLLASISILGPAIARISRWPGLGGDLGPFVPAVLILLLAALVVYDSTSIKRPHRATIVGGGILLLIMVAGIFIGKTEFGQAFVRGMW